MTGTVEGRLAEGWVKVRLLHGPEDASGALFCTPCDELWPCATARLVYTHREVDVARAAALAGTPPQTEDGNE